MSGLEVNKIIASIIFAVLIVTLIGHFGDLIINIDHHDDKETAYKIDVDEAPTGDGISLKKEEVIEPISALLVSASMENGEKLFKKCSTCHNYEKGGANKVGPQLWNLINRPKANVEGFAYSKALAEYGAKVIVCPTNVEPEDPRSYYSVAAKLGSLPNSVFLDQYFPYQHFPVQ